MNPLHDITIAGAGVTGWLAAAALARNHAGRGGSVTVVPLPGADDSLDPFGPVAQALPGNVEDLASLLGLSPADIMRAGGGGFSLGTAFRGWAGTGSVSFLPFGETGADLNGVAFPHLVWRARAAGAQVRMTDYSLATLAAQAERFALPSPDMRSVLSTLAPGAFIDLRGLAALARAQALAAGARLAPAPLSHVRRNEDGGVAALVLADDNEVSGGWYIDATGPRALLATQGNGWVDWQHWLPCDRYIVEQAAAEGTPPPYALHGADSAGWTRRLPLRQGAWVTKLGIEGGQGFTSGRRERAWHGNVLALGAASCLMDPVGGTALALLISSIRRMLALYPVAPGEGPEAGDFNRQAVDETERARDFLIQRFRCNGKLGEPFWDAARRIEPPEPLAHKLALYESRGRIPLYDGELFGRADWMNMLDAAGIHARRCDAQAAALSDTDIMAHLEKLRGVLLRAAGNLPSHAQALARLLGDAA
ncbi:tryptophan 7-halogenase [Niveispirillum sp. KHB5.9]|uniref:tryptophan 7-halogenase n=1 Tax=Niveispirillum sp. KHB5.9 TaxID=3400269 RepID=UPI003A8BBC58